MVTSLGDPLDHTRPAKSRNQGLSFRSLKPSYHKRDLLVTRVSSPAVSASVNGEPQVKKIPLIEGGKLRCPNCGQVQHLHWYRAFDRPAEFARELNVIYQCPTYKGGCNHVFSPGDPQIMEAYLSGKLVPVEAIPDLIYAALGFDPRPKADFTTDTEEDANA